MDYKEKLIEAVYGSNEEFYKDHLELAIDVILDLEEENAELRRRLKNKNVSKCGCGSECHSDSAQ